MGVMEMKAISSRGFVHSLLAGIGLLILSAGLTSGSDGRDSERQIAVTINPGETYVIKDLSAGATPAVHVMDNPNALIVNSERPGELALSGAAAGKWKIDVETAAGEKVTYRVNVGRASSPASPELVATKDPVTEPLVGHGASDAPVTVAALDVGSGPVTSRDAVSTARAGAGASSASTPPPTTRPATVAAASAPMVLASASPEPVVSAPASSALMPPPVENPAAITPVVAHTTLADSSGSAVLPPVSNPYTSTSSPNMAPLGKEEPPMVMTSQGPQPRTERYRNDPPAAIYGDSINGGTHYLPEDVVELSSGSSSIYDFPRRIRRISIADTSVADLQVVNPFQINLVGHKEGFTTLAVWDTHGQYEERQIRVDPFGRQQVMLNVIVSELNRSRIEDQGINWAVAMPKLGLSLVGLAGNLNSISQGQVPPVGGQIFPLMMSPNLNYAVAGRNSDISALAFFQFLETHQLAKILAEPKLMTNSGEKAEFLSGGEIPIVLAQALNTSIVFKEFGVSVIFVPTVIGKDDILLEVKPEVSQPDFAHGVSLFGFTVPAFVTRRAQTFVRLKNNQMLIIAGLLLRTKTSIVNKTPYIGDIPYLGALFKSTSYQDQNTDLVMAVTPEIVNPIPSNGQPVLPTDRPQFTAEDIRTERVVPEDASRSRF
jgi:Flp pilus assembly secretin CpaC